MQIYEELLNLKKKGENGILITVVEKDGFGPATPGIKMLVTKNKRIGTVGGGSLEEFAYKKALDLLKNKKNELHKYALNEENKVIENTGMVCGGNVTLFYEYIGSGEKLYIFGAGHVGKALTYHINPLNYFVTVIDERDGIFNDFPNINKTINSTVSDFFKNNIIEDNSYIVISTPSHAHDYEVLKNVYLNSKPKYIGMLASDTKANLMVKKLKDEVSNADLSILHTPVGLDIGGPTPHEIAISIISEIQSIKYQKKQIKKMRKIW
ncbi:dehydrogenase [Tepiditoga spiralis]|uniref:Dehydrogenase n=1 Tax=Tepiditoga spiralis TaxID=2108365 RepID=A0A7G1G178_9BACT|nr:XdhC/CoxI family protein [Tepiditoga spiralis]BBE30001.1 dehydrogenase [Tepiditoga spiralis]